MTMGLVGAQLEVEFEKINIQSPISIYYIHLVNDLSILDFQSKDNDLKIHHLPIWRDDCHFGFKVNV